MRTRYQAVLFLFVLTLDSLPHLVLGRILGGFILPHGGIALNPSRFQTPSKWAKQWAWTIHRSSVEVGKHIRSLKPDLLLLSTPHGVADLNQFVFYLNSRGNGSAQTDNCYCPPCCYDVDVKFDFNLTRNLVGDLSSQGYNVSGLSFFGPPGVADQPTVLKWGEVIPLTFVKDLSRTKLLMLSHPSRRYTDSVNMIPELLSLGSRLYETLEAIPESVVVLISADLAHTHDPSGPYGFSPAAEPFDRACGAWAATLHPNYLLQEAKKYVDDAKSCGFTGLVLLHGLLESGKLTSWIPVLHANHHPSYYGMMVASFSRTNGQGRNVVGCINCTPHKVGSKRDRWA